MSSSDRFEELVKVHKVLGGKPESVRVPLKSAPKRLMHRLRDRARSMADSMIDRRKPKPEAADAIDQQLDEHVLDPNRKAIVRRTVALERWLTNHGFQAGTPLHLLRGHRVLHHHGEAMELPVARPVVRADYQSADRLLTTRVLDGIARKRPQSEQGGRVTVIPGFILLELPFDEFDAQLGLGETASTRYGHVAIGSVEAGPVIVATRDLSGDMLAHVLAVELAHELAAVGTYSHQHSVPTPGELLHQPHRIHSIEPKFLQPASLDHVAEQVVGQRLRHLTHSCRSTGALTLSDLGFTQHDWVPLGTAHHHGTTHRAVATIHLASLLLAQALLAALADHDDQRDALTVYPSAALADVDCDSNWHRHATAYHQYHSFVQAAPTMGPVGLDELYQRLIDPAFDFSHAYATPHPVRLHLYPAPLHPVV